MTIALLDLTPGLAAAALILGSRPLFEDIPTEKPSDPPSGGDHAEVQRDCKAA